MKHLPVVFGCTALAAACSAVRRSTTALNAVSLAYRARDSREGIWSNCFIVNPSHLDGVMTGAADATASGFEPATELRGIAVVDATLLRIFASACCPSVVSGGSRPSFPES